MGEWLRSSFTVTEEGLTVESIGADGHKVWVAIEDFIVMFGEEPPVSVTDLKSRDPNDKFGWHQHFDAWGFQGILPL